MLIDLIEKIRQKPAHQRQFFIWTIATIVMILVIFLWLAFGIQKNPLFEENISEVSKKNQAKSNRFLDLIDEARGDFLYLKDQAGQKLGDFFSGKNDPDPEELPGELKQYLPQNTPQQRQPLNLPSTD
jgi:hypothetical protein